MILAHADIELKSTSDIGGRMTRRRAVESKWVFKGVLHT
jgi:hypothetical protein